MSKWISVAREEELPAGARFNIDLTEDSVIVLNVNGTYYCIADLCTHDGGPLEDGEVFDCQIECPRHGARFDIRTGKVTRLPAIEPIPVFAVKVDDGIIYVEDPEAW